MAEHQVTLVANEGIFKGLAKQNMLFHQCIGELIDNSIASKNPDTKFRIDLILLKNNDDNEIEIYIADNCKGMNLEVLKKALQLGESATTENRLNEHGFGLKNALATLSGENGYWKIWTKSIDDDNICTAEGPFKANMIIRDNESFPENDFLPTDYTTLVRVKSKLSFIQTVQGRGAPAKDLNTLRQWMAEHLGVLYRGYLEQDSKSFDSEGTIIISINNDSIQVPPVKVPLGNSSVEYFDIEINGEIYKLQYVYGTLDTVKRDSLVRGQSAKYYYQGNIPAQGIDIRLGKRTIATRQFESIWKSERGDSQLSRHNNYNDFIGELLIPEVPRKILSTINNKTDFNWDDENWTKIFDIINNYRPPKNIREKSEKALRLKWMDMLKATNPEDTITDERSIWPTGTKIDVYRKTTDNKVIIYEMKVGDGSPIHLYQLKMYWDGLVLSGEQPKEGILLVENFSTTLEEMANQMNQITPPIIKNQANDKEIASRPYNFKLAKHQDKGL